jgi:hypothetical protein
MEGEVSGTQDQRNRDTEISISATITPPRTPLLLHRFSSKCTVCLYIAYFWFEARKLGFVDIEIPSKTGNRDPAYGTTTSNTFLQRSAL